MAAHSKRIRMVRSDGSYDRTAVNNLISDLPSNRGKIKVVSIIEPPTAGRRDVRNYLKTNHHLETDHNIPESTRNRFFVFLTYIINVLATALYYLGKCFRGTMFDNSTNTSNRAQAATDGTQSATDGIYLTRCSKHKFVLLMDVESSDPSKGEQHELSNIRENTRRASLLALFISNVLLLELPSSEIGSNLRAISILWKIMEDVVKQNGGTITRATPGKRIGIVVALHEIDGTLPETETIGNNYKNEVDEVMKNMWNDIVHRDNGTDNVPKINDYMEVSVLVFPSNRVTIEFNKKCEELMKLLAKNDAIRERGLLLCGDNFSNSVQKIWTSIAEKKDLSLHSENGEELRTGQLQAQAAQRDLTSADTVPDIVDIVKIVPSVGTSPAENNVPNRHSHKNVLFSWKNGLINRFVGKTKDMMIKVSQDMVARLPQEMHKSNKIEMISGEGNFNDRAVERLMVEQKNKYGGKEHNVVSIIGPQSCGKSYLLNQLFQTDFNVMDKNRNWGQTTQGIWIGVINNKSEGSSTDAPPMVIMDVEGSDSSTRVEEGTSFENRSALLALIISNVMLLNLKATAFEQHHGSCVPLLETIFRARKKENFPKQKTKIVVTLRDCNDWTKKDDAEHVQTRMKKAWDSVNKDEKFEDYIEVHVVMFPHYEVEAAAFRNQCALLAEWLRNLEITSGAPIILTAGNFSNNVQTIWKTITKDEDLDTPSFNELLSRTKCHRIMEKIMNSQCRPIEENRYAAKMKNSKCPKEFNNILRNELLFTILNEFDTAAAGYDDEVKEECRKNIELELINLVGSSCQDVSRKKIEHMITELEVKIPNEMEEKTASFWDSLIWLRGQVLTNVNIDTGTEEYMEEFEELHKDLPDMYKSWIAEARHQHREALKKILVTAIKEIQEKHRTTVKEYSFLVTPLKPVLRIIRMFRRRPPGI